MAAAAVATAALTIAACSSSASSGSGAGSGATATTSGGNYQLGATISLTGGFASIATGWNDGLKAYFDWVNSNGGINGHKVTLTVLDDAGNAATGVSNTRQLVQDSHVSAEFVYLSDVAVASAPLLNSSKTPAILAGPTTSLLDPAQPEIYGGANVVSQEAYAQLPFAQKLLNNKNLKVAIITAESVVLEAYAKTAAALVQKDGGTVTTSQEVPTTATSASAQAQVIANTHPDVILMSLPAPLQISAVTTLEQDGINVPVLSTTSGSAYSTLQQLADPNLYADTNVPYANMVNGTGVSDGIAAAKADNINPNEPVYFLGTIDGSVVASALKACGYPCSPAQMTSALNGLGSFSTNGLGFGQWDYSATNHQGMSSLAIVHWDKTTNNPAVVAQAQIPL